LRQQHFQIYITQIDFQPPRTLRRMTLNSAGWTQTVFSSRFSRSNVFVAHLVSTSTYACVDDIHIVPTSRSEQTPSDATLKPRASRSYLVDTLTFLPPTVIHTKSFLRYLQPLSLWLFSKKCITGAKRIIQVCKAVFPLMLGSVAAAEYEHLQ